MHEHQRPRRNLLRTVAAVLLAGAALVAGVRAHADTCPARPDPQFQAQAASYFAPVRYLAPAQYAAELQSAEAGFRQLWKEMPWADT